MGIKESLEILAAIELLGVSGIEIAKDGINADDISKALDLIKNSDVLVEGVKGINLVDEEIKDLEQEELIQLGLAAFGMIKKIISATKKEAVV